MARLHCSIQIRLAKEEIFFGPGVLTLLKLTQDHGSLSGAAKSMDLSYTKANKMVKGSEAALGFKLLDRKIGGAGGGGSRLTEEGLEFIERYMAFEREMEIVSSEMFVRYLGEYI